MSIRILPVDIKIEGETFTIPALPAADWLVPLMDWASLDLFEVFPGFLSGEDQERVWDMIMDGSLPIDEIGELAFQVISTASGRPWWVALRLVALIANNSHTLGAEMLMRGVDAERLSFSGWLDVSLYVALRSMKKEEVTMFTMRLEQVPPQEAGNQPEPEIAMDQFLSMAD
jgi:hypothetical protein